MRNHTSGRKRRDTFRRRNYAAEYQRRLAKGFAAGKSRSAARGHARAIDLPKPPPGPINRDDPRERALKMMRAGATQRRAAKLADVSEEQLRRYRQLHTTSERRGRHWLIFDSRPQAYWIASGGQMRSVTLPNDEGSSIGHYWSAVQAFVDSNDPVHLDPYRGEGVRDVNGRLWRYEVRPNVLRKLDSIGELDFVQVYADVVK